MAKVFIPGDFTPEKSRFFQIERLALDKVKKAFEKDDNTILYFRPIIYVPSKGREIAPDLIWFKYSVGAVVIEVKAWDLNFLKNCTVENGVLKYIPSGKTFANPLREVRNFIEGLLDLARPPLGWLFFLPNLSYKDYNLLPEEIKKFLPPERTIFLEDYVKDSSKELIREKILGAVADFYNKLPKEVIEKETKKLKGALFPYLEVPNSDNAILDEIQEQILFSVKGGHRIIRGGPGSGKTVTLIGKALHEALKSYIANEPKKIVFLTYTNALVKKITEDFKNLISKRNLPKEILDLIEIRTFHSYAGKILNSIKGKTFQSKGEDVINTLVKVLKEENLSVPEEFKADLLLVDESQDLKLEWFDFIRALPKEGATIIFGVDETQRIYEGTDWKWKDTGFEARGRTIILRKLYRSAGNILDLGVEFLKRDPQLVKQLKELDSFWLDRFEKAKTKKGNIEIIETNKVLSKTSELLKELLKRYKPGEILVLSPYRWDNLKSYLLKVFGSDIIAESKEIVSNKVNVTTFYSSKGLEAQAVILLGFDKLFELAKDGKKETLRRLRRLGYVAITRAQEELYFLGDGNSSPFKEVKQILQEKQLNKQ